MITIYGKAGCTSCISAKSLCESKGLEYTYKSLGVDYNVSEFMSIKEGHRSFPLILKDGEYVGTFTDLKNLLNPTTI